MLEVLAPPEDSRTVRLQVPDRGGGPAWRVVRQTSRRTSSSAPVAQETTWNGSAHRTACGARAATTPAIQSAPSAETWVILRGAVGAEGVEERVHGLGVPAGRGPHQLAGVVVDDHHDVLVAALIGDLVDPDPPQPGQRVGGGQLAPPIPGR